jgi:SAM-dependent methyltransferase
LEFHRDPPAADANTTTVKGLFVMTESQDRDPANAAQIEYWNSGPGAKWVSLQEDIDASFAGIKDRLLERAAVKTGERALEIGCGTGATAMDLASRVGPDGHVLGVDIARPLLGKAKARTAQAGLGNVHYVLADAQIHIFKPGDFDLAVSRFGVMFFADPIAAFSNVAAALRAGGRIAFVSWASLEENPWFHIPRDAAIARLGEPEAAPANAPGPMAFQDTDYVSDILLRAGLSGVSAAVEVLPVTARGSLEEVSNFASNLGPVARIVKEKDGTPDDVAAIAREIAKSFGDYVVEGGLSVPATLNFYAAVKR